MKKLSPRLRSVFRCNKVHHDLAPGMLHLLPSSALYIHIYIFVFPSFPRILSRPLLHLFARLVCPLLVEGGGGNDAPRRASSSSAAAPPLRRGNDKQRNEILMKYPGRARPFFASRLTTDASGVEEKVAGEGGGGDHPVLPGSGGGERVGGEERRKPLTGAVSRSRWIKVN